MIGPPRFYRKDVTAGVTASMFRGANSMAHLGCNDLGTEAVVLDEPKCSPGLRRCWRPYAREVRWRHPWVDVQVMAIYRMGLHESAQLRWGECYSIQ